MNAKMKVLSLALVGLCGFAGSAMAVCPAGPTTPDGGAWTSAVTQPSAAASPAVVAVPGLDGSECKLTTALAVGNTAASSFVRYNHAASEPNYRFQFLVDTSNLLAFSSSSNVVIYQAPATTAANGFNRLLRVVLVQGNGSATRVRFIAQTSAGAHIATSTFATDLAPGVHRIEGKLGVGAGAAGQLTYWVDAAAGTTEPAASGTIANLDNAAWGGVSAASLGLTAPSAAFVAAAPGNGGKTVGFDTFDSRRQTYIGH